MKRYLYLGILLLCSIYTSIAQVIDKEALIKKVTVTLSDIDLGKGNPILRYSGKELSIQSGQSSSSMEVPVGETVSIIHNPLRHYHVKNTFLDGVIYEDDSFEVEKRKIPYIVKIEYEANEYNVQKDNTNNGSFTLSREGLIRYVPNTRIDITATPNEGYELDQILINGKAISDSHFILEDDVIVKVTFRKISLTVSKDPNISNGSISLSHEGAVDYGTRIEIQNTPAEGYELVSIKVNGKSITGTSFEVKENSVVSAEFRKRSLTVSKDPNISNGSISLSREGAVDYGTRVEIQNTPAEGYKLVSIKVNGKSITGTSFEVKENSVVSAEFTKKRYRINVEDPENGRIDIFPNDEEVDHGTEIIITPIPNEGYEIDEIIINDKPGKKDRFIIDGNTNVRVRFKKKILTVSKGVFTGGDITISPIGKVEWGTEISLTNTPMDEFHIFEHYNVNGQPITGSSFIVKENSEVTASFTELIISMYNVSKEVTEGGIVILSEEGRVRAGTKIKVEAIANEHYKLKRILLNGKLLEEDSFEVRENSIVKVEFEKEQYNVSAIQSEGGVISLSEEGMVEYGKEISIDVKLSKNYELKSLKVNDNVIKGKSFKVDGNSVVSAEYELVNVEVEQDGEWIIFKIPNSLIGKTSRLYDMGGRLINIYKLENSELRLYKKSLVTSIYAIDFGNVITLKFKVKH